MPLDAGPTSAIRIASLVALLSFAFGAGGALADARVDPRIAEAHTSGQRPRVFVALSDPAPNERDRSAHRRAVRAATDRVLGRLPTGEFRLRRRFDAFPGLALEASEATVRILLREPNVLRVDLDDGGTGHLAEAIPLVGLDAVHLAGFTGDGVTVAVIDSGAATTHPDLSDAIIDEHCFCSGGGGCCPNGSVEQAGAGSAEDDHGHGTNVTGIVTSNGTIAPAGGAPDAKVVAVKVLDENNSFCCASDVVAALDWVLTTRPDVDLVNLSLGSNALFEGDCDQRTAYNVAYADVVSQLHDAGVVVFASAGNQASHTKMSSPACIDRVVSVGAVWDGDVGPKSVLGCTDPTTAADQITCFSNHGPTTDVFAPGAPMTSTGVGAGISTFHGTSQATPLSLSCAATLLEAHPALSPRQIELALETSPITLTEPESGFAFPRLDCPAAHAALAAGTCSVDADCDDGDPCRDDVCLPIDPESDIRGCVHPPSTHPGCTAVCPATPADRCRPPAIPAGNKLKISRGASPDQATLGWSWSHGSVTPRADFGDPVGSTGYKLCIYDGAGRIFDGSAPAAGTCQGSPCWKPSPSGFGYSDPAGSSDGLRTLRLTEGLEPKRARIRVRGSGPLLQPLPPPYALPVRAQLSNDLGHCWEATFPSAQRNDTTQLKARLP